MARRRCRPLAVALTATLAAGALTPLLAPPAAAQDPVPTVAGSFQSELGCPEDWQPACPHTALADPDQDGVFTGDFTVPAGQWEFKVATKGDWSQAFGANDNPGENAKLSLAAPTRLTFAFDTKANRVGLTSPALTASGTAVPGDAELARPAVRQGKVENFYFVLTDRFHNGDTTNDQGLLEGDRLTTGFDPSNSGFFHGGDIDGLIAKLDYISSLGTTAIWLTPSFVNLPVQGTGEHASAGYHGYWVTDFTQIDPHLGGNEALKRLTQAAHARGIKVYFDIITNHTADGIAYQEQSTDYVPTDQRPYTDAEGTVLNLSSLAQLTETAAAPKLSAESSFPYRPVARPDVVKHPEWLNDVTLYHNRGDSTWSGESVTLGDFVGLDDLMTEHPQVVNGFIDVYQSWIDMGIDGYRIDTVKHVNFEFWQRWSAAIKAHAAKHNPDFFTFGEVYDADPALLAPYVRDTDMDATLDFAFQAAAVNFAKGYPTAGLSSTFAADDLYATATTSAATLPTFLGNHDMGRVAFLVGENQREDRSVLAHQLLYLTRGQPVVYYGDEQGFVGIGDGKDKHARQSLFASQVAEYVDQPLANGQQLGATDRYATDTRLYTTIKELAALRAAHPALASGAQLELGRTDGAGIYALARVDREQKTEYLVALNNAPTPSSLTVTTLTPGAAYAPLYGTEQGVQASQTGEVTLEVPALSAVVYRADRQVAGGAGPVQVALADGANLSGATAALPATTGAHRWAETTFALRPLGTSDWQVVGVAEDDTPRVFADTRAWQPGTVLEARAVTTDAAGQVSGDSALLVVGQDLSLAADTTPPPAGDLITVPGSFNAALGCAKDWMPECANIALTKDAASGLYIGRFPLPAGTFEWKVAVGGSWEENYGAGGTPNGSNLQLTSTGQEFTFIYNPTTHVPFAVPTRQVVTLPGSWQAALGCTGGANGGNWQPDCLATAMVPQGDGTWLFETDKLPAGNWELKVAVGGSWEENYGVDGAPGGPNYTLSTNAGERLQVRYDEKTHKLTFDVANPPLPGAGQAQAYWLTPTTVAWPAQLGVADGTQFELVASPDGAMQANGQGAATKLDLTLGGPLEGELLAAYPHLADYRVLQVPEADVASLLQGELAVRARQGDQPVAATGLQLAGVIDSLYGAAAQQTYGPSWQEDALTLRLWAPTARSVQLKTWQADGSGEETLPATRAADGSWTVSGDRSWLGRQYRWLVEVYVPSLDKVTVNEVTDPASLALTVNSQRSVVVDLADPELAPAQWQQAAAPTVRNDAARSIWELHVRDFSITDTSVPEAERGTYKAFTRSQSHGMRHLRQLADAGINTVHLLPTFDIATIEEERSKQVHPQIPGDAGPDSQAQQAAVSAVADQDGFNWGYDPFHYSVPEGSYATDANQSGGMRTYEFREMVGALHAAGVQVVLDQVFNHTAAAGQDAKSVLDQVVPGYYHRLSPTGSIETSTCCQNIATENVMGQKLMVDSVVTWAKHYKVDGFRFDLMGHHSRPNMEAVRAALDELTVERDGVDGKAIYLYGEGWNFGEVANNKRFVQATQGQLDGTGIGSFNDRLRDAVHGGGPFDEDKRTHQGFGTGLATDPNGLSGLSAAEQRTRLGHLTDLVRLGMAGNLKDYEFVAFDGKRKAGRELDYNGAPGGYASQPQESVNYVDAHDNETLFDLGVYKLPVATSMADRVRMNTVSLATVTWGQSPSFWHAGTELLRSKSLDRDSFNSGDHFNAIDWTAQRSNFGVGLPVAGKNQEKWPIQGPLLANKALVPTPQDLQAARAAALDLLRVRSTTPLLSLGTADLIRERVTFPLSGPQAPAGVLLMQIDDAPGQFATDLDPRTDTVLVAINASPQAQSLKVDSLAGKALQLHPALAGGADEVVKGTKFADGQLTIPARTAAVLLAPRTAEPTPTPTPTQSATPTASPTPTPTPTPTPGDRVTRVAGPSRISTALAAFQAGNWSGDAVVLISGTNPADAFGATPLADLLDAPVLLTGGKQLEPAVRAALADSGKRRVFIVGGQATVSEAIAAELQQQGLAVTRLAGTNRYTTALAVAQHMRQLDPQLRGYLVADGAQLVDALPAGALAPRAQAVLLPSNGGALPPEVVKQLQADPTAPITAVGGNAARALDRAGITGERVQLVQGPNRYATAALLAERLAPAATEVMLANGPDALSAGAFAAGRDGVLLFNPPASLPQAVRAELQRRNPRLVTLVGGQASLSPDLVPQINQLLH
ncbi:pullulanase-type alpha-1,6-glucosidase [Buchananella hordeovulneris]|uniref:pullulanase-type alpha-1,6-glucosidase n=1 Tax=Buchananella hordeovulneris TaxID=52770 RepID=UPI000F5ED36B|nr:pullulanase-type alpha-1,6-glucosidase [Buchananella hordeovulneris]RRD51717.1 pullulanase-type alpha-1,6-glucosidase [Buchananella hordeovulneris]